MPNMPPLRHTVLTTCILAALVAPGAGAATLDFSRDVRPILSENCFQCHGQDANKRKGELRLDTREGATGKAESGEVAVVPGKPEASTLVARIFSTDKDEQMPPAKANRTLTAEQKAVDREARLTISAELGHEREQVTAVYLGR